MTTAPKNYNKEVIKTAKALKELANDKSNNAVINEYGKTKEILEEKEDNITEVNDTANDKQTPSENKQEEVVTESVKEENMVFLQRLHI